MRWKVLVTRRIPSLELLEKYADIEILREEGIPSKQEIIEKIGDKDALICLLTDKIDKEVIDNAKNLKVIGNYAVGVDNIDVDYATQKGIVVLNTPDVLTNAVAELTWALILSAARRIVEGHKMVERGEFHGWSPNLLLGIELKGKTLGVVGFGRIGREVARKARGFGMRVIYYSRSRKEAYENMLNAEFRPLEKLMEEADVITIHTPLTKETYHLIGRDELAKMKKNAILVNVARGGVVDEESLIQFLKEKRIFYAALDVYENEPNVKEDLKNLENVVLAPHIGSATFETRRAMGELVVRGIIDLMNGKIPENIVNPSVVNAERKRITALVLAGGYARRLAPISDFIAKPLLPINGKPLLNRIVDMLKIKGVERIVITTNKKYEDQFRYWMDTMYSFGFDRPMELIIEPTTREEEKFGAIKGINYAIEKANINTDLIIVAGDNVMEIDMEDFVKKSENKFTVALYDLKDLEEAKRFGVVKINEEGKIVDFEEKPPQPKSTLICAGCYFVPRNMLGLFEEYIKEGNNPDSPGYFVQWLYRKKEVYGYVIGGVWMDIGTIKSYEEALKTLKGRW